MFVGVALVGHALVFYLFKVVTPTATRHLPPEESVLLIKGADGNAISLLASLEDRSPAGMLVVQGRGADDHLPRLPLPTYTPSFENYRPALHFDWEPTSHFLPALADAQRPILPQLEKNPPAPRPAPATLATGATPQMVLDAALVARGLRQPPRWSAKLRPPEEIEEPFIFHLGIDSSGIVRYCLADGMAPPAAITNTVSTLRFAPRPGASLLWGEVEVHW